jgi:hypothetical protein
VGRLVLILVSLLHWPNRLGLFRIGIPILWAQFDHLGILDDPLLVLSPHFSKLREAGRIEPQLSAGDVNIRKRRDMTGPNDDFLPSQVEIGVHGLYSDHRSLVRLAIELDAVLLPNETRGDVCIPVGFAFVDRWRTEGRLVRLDE